MHGQILCLHPSLVQGVATFAVYLPPATRGHQRKTQAPFVLKEAWPLRRSVVGLVAGATRAETAGVAVASLGITPGGLACAGNSGRGTLRKLQDSEKCESRGWTRPDPALGQGPQAARAGGNRGGSPRTRAQGATGVLTLLLTTRRDPLYCTCMFRSREGCDVFGE